jgi:2-polyprenyl-3-methyl-5-hydroxy-6-metoxy-1,4-benzoquinol methylase
VGICPICNGEHFLDDNKREKVRCSKCKSLERTRLLWLILEELLPSDKLLDVFHFAPEEGIARKLRSRYGARYRLFDLNPKLYCFDFAEVEQLDLCHGIDEFRGNSVDVILHNHVMEHLPCNYFAVMVALNALLRPGGLHIFSLPIIGNYYRESLDPNLTELERRVFFAQGDHVRAFGRLDTTEKLQQLFHENIHFSKLVHLSEESLRQAAIPTNVLTKLTSNTVFAWRKPARVSTRWIGRKMEIEPPKIYGKFKAFAALNRTIAPGDGMFNEIHPEHYFAVGASAAHLISESLAAACVPPGRVERVLDYACGYGRVLRWLRVEFPQAFLLGVDSDPKAVRGCNLALGVETRQLDLSFAKPIDAPFDLIWVGSLMTHVPEWETLRVIQYLKTHLTNGGVLVLTTHGDLVYERLRLGERHYNIAKAGIGKIIREFDWLGYGHASYGHSGYGISVCKPSRIVTMIETCNLVCVYFKARGWAAHQDVFGCVNP